MKARNKERLKIAIYSVILVLYLIGFAIIFNYKQVFGIGYYLNNKNFTTSYSGGNGGINVEIYALHIGATDHYYGMKINSFSNPDSNLEGITYLDFRIETSVPKKVETINYSTPITTYSIGYLPRLQTKLYQYDNLTCRGFADVIFKVNGIDEIHRISFEVSTIIKLDGEAINYELGNLSTWINVIYLSCTAIPLTFLFRSIRSYKFSKWYSDDMRERDEEFLREMRRQEEIQTSN
jgi:hypothetical protein